MSRIVYTPHAIETIREMAANGESAEAIAVAIGSTTGSVRVKACQLKIKLGGRPGRPFDSDKPHFTVLIDTSNIAKLLKSASERCCTPHEVVTRIVNMVLRDDLVDGVLDDAND